MNLIGVVLVPVGLVLIGLLAITKGQKFFSIFLSVFSFVLVFDIVVKNYGQTATSLAFALGAAVVGAILAQYAQKLSFFLLGLIFGVFFGAMILPFIKGIDANVALIALLVFGVVCGILTAHWDKVFIRVATGFLGGRLVGIGALFLVFHLMNLQDYAASTIVASCENTLSYLNETFSMTYSSYIFASSVICAVVAFFVQQKKRRRR